MLNLAGTGLSAIATLAVTVLVTRHFSRPMAGAFFAATSLFLIVEASSNLGAFNGVIYFIAPTVAAGGGQDPGDPARRDPPGCGLLGGGRGGHGGVRR